MIMVLGQAARPSLIAVGAVAKQRGPADRLVLRATTARTLPVRAEAGIEQLAMCPIKGVDFFRVGMRRSRFFFIVLSRRGSVRPMPRHRTQVVVGIGPVRGGGRNRTGGQVPTCGRVA